MAGAFDAAAVSIPCGNCGRNHKKTIRWLRTHTEIDCEYGTKTRLESGQFKAGMAKAERALNDLKKALKGFGS